jgi:hypothetical protein
VISSIVSYGALKSSPQGNSGTRPGDTQGRNSNTLGRILIRHVRVLAERLTLYAILETKHVGSSLEFRSGAAYQITFRAT